MEIKKTHTEQMGRKGDTEMEGWRRWKRHSDGYETDRNNKKGQELRGSVTKLRLKEAVRAVNLGDAQGDD